MPTSDQREKAPRAEITHGVEKNPSQKGVAQIIIILVSLYDPALQRDAFCYYCATRASKAQEIITIA